MTVKGIKAAILQVEFSLEKMALTAEEVKKLAGLIYYCPQCDVYHPEPKRSLSQITAVLERS